MTNLQPLNTEADEFLREGLRHYAPGLLAIEEFGREVRDRIQEVVLEFANELKTIGLPVDKLTATGSDATDEDLSAESSWIGSKCTYGRYGCGYYVYWDLNEPKEQQLFVGAWIYHYSKANRDLLFAQIIKNNEKLSSKLELADQTDGTYFSMYLPLDKFPEFQATLRSLLKDMTVLCAGIDNILNSTIESANRLKRPS